MRTTRILAELDDETSGTESLYIRDEASGLPDTLLRDYELRGGEHSVSSESPVLTEAVADDSKMVHDDIPTTAAAVKHQRIVISSSSSDNVNSQTCPQRGRPQKSHSNVDETDSSPLLALDEYNVGPVLEKLLAMMQSMSMLLSALKNDLRHSNMPEVVAKKRDAATTQLWRAFVAYQKSFSEIEQFAGLSKLPDESVHVSTTSQSSVKRDVAVKSAGRSQRVQVRETDVIELSESESDEDVECKRPRYDAAATAERSAPSSVSSAAVEVTGNSSPAASSSELSIAPSTVTSDVSFDVSSEKTASCVCVDTASD